MKLSDFSVGQQWRDPKWQPTNKRIEILEITGDAIKVRGVMEVVMRSGLDDGSERKQNGVMYGQEYWVYPSALRKFTLYRDQLQ